MDVEPETHSPREAAGVSDAKRTSPSTANRLVLGLALALVLAAAVGAYAQILVLDHLGSDTHAMILTSRIEHPGDVLRIVSQELMQGRFSQVSFYRPVTSLSLALDHALGGLDPFGYHVTDLLLVLAGALAVFGVGRRLSIPSWAAVLGATFYALHPVHFESLPVTARRNEPLCTLLLMLALLALPRPRSGLVVVRACMAGVLTLLAAGAKETGLLAAPLVIGLALLEANASRARWALRVCAPALIAALVFVVARTLVLGGLGGHGESSLLGALQAPVVLPHYLGLLLAPHDISTNQTVNALALTALGVGLAGTLALACKRVPLGRRAMLLLLFWLASLAALIGVSGKMQAWHTVSFLPPYALAVGIGAAAAARQLRDRRVLTGMAAALVVVALGWSNLRACGLLHDYDQWRQASVVQRLFFESLQQRLAAAPIGTTLAVEGLPGYVSPRRGRPGVQSVVGLAPHSVQAWAELTFPDRRIRVVTSQQGAIPAARPDEVLVSLVKEP